MPEDPERTLEAWQDSMQAEHAAAIANPDPEETHRIEGITQVSYRYSFAYDADDDCLRRVDRTQVDDPQEPELFSCACGVRGMTRTEAREHLAALTD
ncbi:Uncharacterized protein SVXHr_1995 [Halorhabdus sp. SVX81]|uniref:hypothetical protein n=1 Tax=Halorhabdus sp. SVX81 TaxID=2978283 RepID=UPI0023DBF1F0|nr:hypothetical protein [Halorhabdus sp. SVX81]WEL18156.1 Uncharacterized protein SVXHr_1995 [Halorhabdus sp. SVX81]